MKKKAQQVGQIFTFIITIVLLGVIFLFGFNSINQIMKNQEKAELVKFKNDLSNSLNSFEYGTVKKVSLSISGDYKELCFIRNYEPNVYKDISCGLDLKGLLHDYPLILTRIDQTDLSQNGPSDNIFLLKSNKQLADIFNIGIIGFNNNCDVFKCFPIKDSKVSFTVEGKSKYIILS
jgi:hypothetical protein